MAINTGVNVSKAVAFAVVTENNGVDISKAVAFAVLSENKGVDVSKAVAFGVLIPQERIGWYAQHPDPVRPKKKTVWEFFGTEFANLNPALVVYQAGLEVLYDPINPLVVHQLGFEVIHDFADPPTSQPISFVVT